MPRSAGFTRAAGRRRSSSFTLADDWGGGASAPAISFGISNNGTTTQFTTNGYDLAVQFVPAVSGTVASATFSSFQGGTTSTATWGISASLQTNPNTAPTWIASGAYTYANNSNAPTITVTFGGGAALTAGNTYYLIGLGSGVGDGVGYTLLSNTGTTTLTNITSVGANMFWANSGSTTWNSIAAYVPVGVTLS